MSKSLQHVLCIDDELDILEIVELCLGSLGKFRVTCISDVRNAIHKLETLRPDLVIVDMMMPNLSGVDAIKPLREVDGFARLPVVLMTARAQPNEVAEYLARGATAVVPKPFDPMTLADQVQKIWEDCQLRELGEQEVRQ